MPTTLPFTIQKLARAQRGIVTRQQLLDAGMSSATITRFVRRGWLVKLHDGVYALPGVTIGFEVAAFASLMAIGPAAVLDGRSAARLHGLRPFRRFERIEVLVPRGCRARPRGVDVRATTVLGRDDRAEVGGIAVTSPARTIVTLAAVATAAETREALADAFLLGVLTPAAYSSTVDRLDHVPGIAIARDLRDGMYGDEGAFRSHTEARALDVLVRGGHRRPLVNHVHVCPCGLGTELDLFLERDRLDVEVDGPHHGLSSQMRRDRERDRHLRLCAGIEVVRWPARAVWSDPHGLLAAVADGRARVHRR